jgi:hypothetical protein
VAEDACFMSVGAASDCVERVALLKTRRPHLCRASAELLCVTGRIKDVFGK